MNTKPKQQLFKEREAEIMQVFKELFGDNANVKFSIESIEEKETPIKKFFSFWNRKRLNRKETKMVLDSHEDAFSTIFQILGLEKVKENSIGTDVFCGESHLSEFAKALLFTKKKIKALEEYFDISLESKNEEGTDKTTFYYKKNKVLISEKEISDIREDRTGKVNVPAKRKRKSGYKKRNASTANGQLRVEIRKALDNLARNEAYFVGRVEWKESDKALANMVYSQNFANKKLGKRARFKIEVDEVDVEKGWKITRVM